MPDTTVAKSKPAATPAPASQDSWQTLRNEVDRVFDRFSGGMFPAVWRPTEAFENFDRMAESLFPPALRRMFAAPAWRIDKSLMLDVPAIDVSEDDAGYKLTAELPGVDEKNVDVAVADGLLTIKGEKHAEKDENAKNRHVSERYYGSFQRSFGLPSGIDQSAITAEFAKGVLTIKLPKTAKAKASAHKIEIKAG